MEERAINKNQLTHSEKILIIDDEHGLLTLVKITLNKEGYQEIMTAETGEEALLSIKNNHFDLILLDIMLPDYSGFELCTEIRRYTTAPIIFLTARTSDYDKLSGFAIGGDDYITKPFNTMELVARIKAIFRRRQLDRSSVQVSSESEKLYQYGSISLDMSCAVLNVEGREILCTAKELELMEFFCKHPNKVFTTAHLYEAVWGVSEYGDEKTVTIHISKLRKKLKDESKPYKVITNLRGIGYKFIPPTGEEW
ncbi:response regulator transcription factor [Enterococcus sp. BWM-S5]|uniref:Response regulator transcription factor n=1 Tax=Enterococcus larvae TaxID=2794352 RepID=A0ABS4CH56_9ENTE|nr:response regulator transcription factor [Enterococcus larvae]MBP1045355.1 response regulator transcription factor [Enterococcus larvae]